MFGVSFGEVMLIAVVALVVVGPRRLPEMLGKAGQWVARARRMINDMRRQTGIDEILRQEGISGGISELRSMLRPDLDIGRYGPGTSAGSAALASRGSAVDAHGEAVDFDRYREYPTEGPDAYGTIPEDLLDAAPEPPAAQVLEAASAGAAHPLAGTAGEGPVETAHERGADPTKGSP